MIDMAISGIQPRFLRLELSPSLCMLTMVIGVVLIDQKFSRKGTVYLYIPDYNTLDSHTSVDPVVIAKLWLFLFTASVLAL